MNWILSFFAGVLFFPFGLSGQSLASDAKGSIDIQFENVNSIKGYIRLALYNRQESFMKEEQAILYNFKIAQSGTITCRIEDLPYGDYAFAVFHDENNNDKLDTNWLGIPTEPYSFSGLSPSKWRLPTFEEAKIRLDHPQRTLFVPLQKWKL